MSTSARARKKTKPAKKAKAKTRAWYGPTDGIRLWDGEFMYLIHFWGGAYYVHKTDDKDGSQLRVLESRGNEMPKGWGDPYLKRIKDGKYPCDDDGNVLPRWAWKLPCDR